jgi:hypothetical protein
MATGTISLALQWRKARATRLAEQKKVDAIEVVEKELKAKVIAALSKSPNKSLSNGERLFQLKTSNEPTVSDWAALYKHVQKTGAFELLFRRVNPAAVKERWELNEKVPGVESLPVETLSDTAVKP